MTDPEELNRLREENARLKKLLTQHGVNWEERTVSEVATAEADFASESIPTQLTTDDKIALFRQLFRGREDVYALRWESSNGRAGYSPACANEWKPGVCEKPRIKCAECLQRRFLPVTDQVIYDHLSGKHTIGVYPLLK